jgi:hypothetical protein
MLKALSRHKNLVFVGSEFVEYNFVLMIKCKWFLIMFIHWCWCEIYASVWLLGLFVYLALICSICKF